MTLDRGLGKQLFIPAGGWADVLWGELCVGVWFTLGAGGGQGTAVSPGTEPCCRVPLPCGVTAGTVPGWLRKHPWACLRYISTLLKPRGNVAESVREVKGLCCLCDRAV